MRNSILVSLTRETNYTGFGWGYSNAYPSIVDFTRGGNYSAVTIGEFCERGRRLVLLQSGVSGHSGAVSLASGKITSHRFYIHLHKEGNDHGAKVTLRSKMMALRIRPECRWNNSIACSTINRQIYSPRIHRHARERTTLRLSPFSLRSIVDL
ncbi:hypothetical protein CI102_14622 [Trichoderma harzianum]|nr:hypothetical protein CI102_14622 [Trichoderma harzianum]